MAEEKRIKNLQKVKKAHATYGMAYKRYLFHLLVITSLSES